MSQQRAFRRKVIYLVIMMPLVLLLLWLSQPPAPGSQAPMKEDSGWTGRITGPYRASKVPSNDLSNTTRIEALMRAGNLYLSLQDAIALALENNLDIVEYAVRKAHRLGVPTLLDPAPAVPLPEDLYPCLDFIKPNENEATILSGINVADPEGAAEAGLWFVQRGVKAAIVTLGQNGAVLVVGHDVKHFPAPRVEAVDTTGAGDIFSGAFMAALWAGESVPASIEFASRAAALSVTRPGVIEAIPERQEVLALP